MRGIEMESCAEFGGAGREGKQPIRARALFSMGDL
jgi:hypothetical protein